ncbi:uncharacterized protein [Haliotis cracherodii]|uniref:uncharacterized protein n=1 Tax=Haliotis cracherodii TaxID=6455 RepID=UPI0039E9A516
MRCLIIAALGLVTLALVDAEGCQGHDTSTCRHESCDALSTLACVRGTCTCLVSSCGTHPEGCHTTANHCRHYASQHNCPCDHSWHCIDSSCQCGYPST